MYWPCCKNIGNCALSGLAYTKQKRQMFGKSATDRASCCMVS